MSALGMRLNSDPRNVKLLCSGVLLFRVPRSDMLQMRLRLE